MMNFKIVAPLKSQRDLDTFRPREYRQPPKDHTVVKCKVIRRCWVTLPGETMRAAKPDEILLMPRWLAEELAANGKASLL